jgi:hypothetical protein
VKARKIISIKDSPDPTLLEFLTQLSDDSIELRQLKKEHAQGYGEEDFVAWDRRIGVIGTVIRFVSENNMPLNGQTIQYAMNNYDMNLESLDVKEQMRDQQSACLITL